VGAPETCATYLRINGSVCSPFCSSEILIYQSTNAGRHACAGVVGRGELHPAGLLTAPPCLSLDEPQTKEQHQSCPPARPRWLKLWWMH